MPGIQRRLADFIRAKMDARRLKERHVAEASGGGLTHGAVNNIVNAKHGDFKVSTLQALAKGLSLSPDEADELFDIARGLDPDKRKRQAALADTKEATQAEKEIWRHHRRIQVVTNEISHLVRDKEVLQPILAMQAATEQVALTLRDLLQPKDGSVPRTGYEHVPESKSTKTANTERKHKRG